MNTSKKITLATVKSFCKKNINNLYIKVNSSFDGMVNCVMPNTDAKLLKVVSVNFTEYRCFKLENGGFESFVGSSRDYFTPIANGYKVSNCCGSFKIITK